MAPSAILTQEHSSERHTNGANGTNGVNGANGVHGTNGVSGTNGVNGTNGHAARINSHNTNGYIVPISSSMAKLLIFLAMYHLQTQLRHPRPSQL